MKARDLIPGRVVVFKLNRVIHIGSVRYVQRFKTGVQAYCRGVVCPGDEANAPVGWVRPRDIEPSDIPCDTEQRVPYAELLAHYRSLAQLAQSGVWVSKEEFTAYHAWKRSQES